VGDDNGSDAKGRVCPGCGSTLVRVERQGIEIDRCPNCRGIWLDRGELEKLLAAGTDHESHAAYERRPDDEGDEPEPAERLATRRSFFAELFDVE
jgi:Zn-finger nucleic acid-binding protein